MKNIRVLAALVTLSAVAVIVALAYALMHWPKVVLLSMATGFVVCIYFSVVGYLDGSL